MLLSFPYAIWMYYFLSLFFYNTSRKTRSMHCFSTKSVDTLSFLHHASKKSMYLWVCTANEAILKHGSCSNFSHYYLCHVGADVPYICCNSPTDNGHGCTGLCWKKGLTCSTKRNLAIFFHHIMEDTEYFCVCSLGDGTGKKLFCDV